MIDIEKFICSLLADHPEGVAVRGDIHRALKEQGLEYKDGKIVPIEDKTELKESKDEKVRKELLNYVIKGKESYYDIQQYGLEKFENWIAWLGERDKSAEINPDEIIEECHQDNADHIIDIVTEQQKTVEWSEEDEKIMSTIMEEGDLKPSERNWLKSLKDRYTLKLNPYSGTSFVYNNHTWGMCARDGGIDILCDSKLIKHIEQGKTIFEKLNEQMPTDKIQLGKEYKCIASPRYTMFLTGYIYKPEDRFLCSLMNLCSDCFELVEDSEQNDFTSNIDKLEPKFKVGDWIITPKNKVLQITSIEDTSYKFNNESHYWEVYYCDKQCRLWSIADAKDGDVLMNEDDYPFIYADKHIYTKYLTAYCGITNDGVFKISDKTELWTNDNVEPASKEQRNMLFSKMKEAGYEWDSEKKELKKIE